MIVNGRRMDLILHLAVRLVGLPNIYDLTLRARSEKGVNSPV